MEEKTTFTRLSLSRRERDLDFWRHDSRSWRGQRVFRWMRHHLSRKVYTKSHSDFRLVPSHLNIPKDFLSDVSIHLGEKYGQKLKPQTKLAPTLEERRKSTSVTLQTCVFTWKMGWFWKKVHRVLSFTQSALTGIIHNPEYRTQEKFKKLAGEGLLHTHE